MSKLMLISSSPTISKRAFARRHGVSPSRVTTWVAQGLPLTPDGKVEAEAGNAWVAKNLDPAKRAAAKPGYVVSGEAWRFQA